MRTCDQDDDKGEYEDKYQPTLWFFISKAVFLKWSIRGRSIHSGVDDCHLNVFVTGLLRLLVQVIVNRRLQVQVFVNRGVLFRVIVAVLRCTTFRRIWFSKNTSILLFKLYDATYCTCINWYIIPTSCMKNSGWWPFCSICTYYVYISLNLAPSCSKHSFDWQPHSFDESWTK